MEAITIGLEAIPSRLEALRGRPSLLGAFCYYIGSCLGSLLSASSEMARCTAPGTQKAGNLEVKVTRDSVVSIKNRTKIWAVVSEMFMFQPLLGMIEPTLKSVLPSLVLWIHIYIYYIYIYLFRYDI